MSEFNCASSSSGGFSDCVCIEAERIYDSCCDKECIENLCVALDGSCHVDGAYRIVKARSVEVTDVCLNVEPTPFNCGFYAIDITYTFSFVFDLYETPCGLPTEITGTSIYSKKAILYGGTGGNSRIFCSEGLGSSNPTDSGTSAPRACIQITDPIVLDARLVSANCNNTCGGCVCTIAETDPTEIPCCCQTTGGVQCINVSLGLFSIIKLTRNVAVSVPIYDFCIPKKHCDTSTGESPCDVFSKIDFPTAEFFPPVLECDSSCGCSDNSCSGNCITDNNSSDSSCGC